MADFSSLKQTIQAYIQQNGNEEITGNILQDVLLAMVSTMGDSAINGLVSALQDEIAARQNQDATLQGDISAEATARQQADTALGGRIDGLQTAINGINTKLAEGYIYAGIATPSTNPGIPSGKVFYIAVSSGTYTNFSNLTVAQGINILKYNGSVWSKDVVYAIDARPKKTSQNLVTSGGVFDNMGALDVSELNATENPHTLAQYADLSAALAAIPTDYQKGGMSIKFVQTSDNKYVQYRLMSDTFNTTVANWQGVDDVPTAGSDNLVKSGGVAKEFIDMRVKSLLTPFESNEGYLVRGNVGEAAYLHSNQNMTANKYNVVAGKAYTFSAKYSSGYTTFLINWVDAEGIIVSIEYKGTSGQVDTWENVPVTAPEGAVTMWMNVQTSLLSVTNFKEVSDELIQVEELEEKTNQYKAALGKKTLLAPFETLTGYRILATIGSEAVARPLEGASLYKYNVTEGKTYTFSTTQRSGFIIDTIYWIDTNNIILDRGYKNQSGQVKTWENVPVTAPEGAVTMWMNVQTSFLSVTNFKEVSDELIQVENLQSQIDNLRSQSGTMKVVINGIGEMATDDVPFYIRTAYNSEKDIIITHIINDNSLITFKYTYVGDKSLTDAQLMTDTYLVSSHSDSTSPLRNYTQYWHLFAQHGYPVPYFANSVGMTSSDVGAEWKDQLDRHFKIGKVTDSYIWLLPIIYQDANGHYTRGWYSNQTSTDITSLTHISGGSYTQQISVSSISQEQLRPIMEVENRKYLINGNIVTEPGTYYADELKVSETEIGYDPATINDWFGNDGKPNLSGAQKHVVFTYNYNYKGAQCSVNTTIHCLREARGDYGGTQQQFFYDKDDYKAMFMIPKAAIRNGIELDKPFNSPSSSSRNYSISRSSSHLKDINDPVDRQIGMLHNPTNDTYLVGIAAGLSLVKGDTVKDKRNQICLEGSSLLNFSPSNGNKFYVNGINTSAFESGYYPAGYFKEVDYYVSYFDPAENVGQVYWYKDGSKYVIYCHCQSAQNILAVNVPAFMDGLKLSIVEKTNSTELLSDTIANGKFFVNYNTADANYIVLIAE